MDLRLDIALGSNYKSETQRARVISESWAARNAFCASCGATLMRGNNNARVMDLECIGCEGQFELKSTRGRFSRKVPDGAFKAMMSRLCGTSSPDFFFLTYDVATFRVTNFFAVPSCFLDKSAIEKRKPLGPTARRAGWVGCNILMDRIPGSGKVFYVKNSEIQKKSVVMQTWRRTAFLRKETNLETRGWTLEILRIIQSFSSRKFTLQNMYEFESRLKRQYPHNNFIRAKIRQQLQVLRDAGLIVFEGRGRYSTTFDPVRE